MFVNWEKENIQKYYVYIKIDINWHRISQKCLFSFISMKSFIFQYVKEYSKLEISTMDIFRILLKWFYAVKIQSTYLVYLNCWTTSFMKSLQKPRINIISVLKILQLIRHVFLNLYQQNTAQLSLQFPTHNKRCAWCTWQWWGQWRTSKT